MITIENRDRRTMSAGVALLLAGGLLVSAGAASAQEFESELMATERSGLPDGADSAAWMQAAGSASATADGDRHQVDVEMTGLMPDGLYTFWWVNPGTDTMSMGPGGGLPGNEFRADAQGTAEVSLDVPADNDYNMMVVAFHADDMTHGEEPGQMGDVSFEHLMGAWPGPDGDMADM